MRRQLAHAAAVVSAISDSLFTASFATSLITVAAGSVDATGSATCEAAGPAESASADSSFSAAGEADSSFSEAGVDNSSTSAATAATSGTSSCFGSSYFGSSCFASTFRSSIAVKVTDSFADSDSDCTDASSGTAAVTTGSGTDSITAGGS